MALRLEERLLPRPRRMERLGERCVDADVTPRAVRTSAAPAQGYVLTLPPLGPGTIEHADDAGLRHALGTWSALGRLSEVHAQPVPALRITDHPSFPVRGLMIDVSRTRVPTMQELFAIVETLAELKGNHLQLYTEHAFAYRGHEDAWAGCSPITPDEVRRLDAHAARHGVTLAANQNCFGHLAHWLRLPKYEHLAETHGEWMFDVWPRSGPFSLCPTDAGSLALVRDWLDQLLPCFSSGLVNIGCDETYDIGHGRSAAAVKARGRGAVYAEFVAQVAREALAWGARPMFWSDIALHDPACLSALPKELLALAWGYEGDAPFAEWLTTLHRAGLEAWVCPGTSSWRSMLGRTHERTANLHAAASAGAAGGATGMLVCDWGDTGHHQPWPVALHAIRQGLARAWNADDGDAGMTHHPLARFFERAGGVDAELRATCGRLARPDAGVTTPLRNQSALFIDLHNHAEDSACEVGAVDAWERALANVRTLRCDWRDAEKSPHGLSAAALALCAAEVEHAINYVEVAAERAWRRRTRAGISPLERSNLVERWRGAMHEHARLWAIRSRPGGLEKSLDFMRKVEESIVAGGRR